MKRLIGGLALMAALVPAVSPASAVRTEQQSYLGAIRAWPHPAAGLASACGEPNVGSACFAVLEGETEVTIEVADVRSNLPVFGQVFVRWAPPGNGSVSFEQHAFCGSATVVLPDDAVEVAVSLGITPSLVGLSAACGSATEGTISAAFSSD